MEQNGGTVLMKQFKIEKNEIIKELACSVKIKDEELTEIDSEEAEFLRMKTAHKLKAINDNKKREIEKKYETELKQIAEQKRNPNLTLEEYREAKKREAIINKEFENARQKSKEEIEALATVQKYNKK